MTALRPTPREVAADREARRLRGWNRVTRHLAEAEGRTRSLQLAAERAAARSFLEPGPDADAALAAARAALVDVEDRAVVCRLALAELQRGATFRGPIAGAA